LVVGLPEGVGVGVVDGFAEDFVEGDADGVGLADGAVAGVTLSARETTPFGSGKA
jgi:hypothetical protein